MLRVVCKLEVDISFDEGILETSCTHIFASKTLE